MYTDMSANLQGDTLIKGKKSFSKIVFPVAKANNLYISINRQGGYTQQTP